MAGDHRAHKLQPPWSRVYSVTHRKEFRNGIQQDATSNNGATTTPHTTDTPRAHEHTKSRVSRVTHRGCTRLYFDYGYSKSKRDAGGGEGRGEGEGEGREKVDSPREIALISITTFTAVRQFRYRFIGDHVTQIRASICVYNMKRTWVCSGLRARIHPRIYRPLQLISCLLD